MNPATPPATNDSADRPTSAAEVVLRFDPSPAEWQTAAPPRRDEQTWRELIELASRWTHLPGIAPLSPSGMLVATGHQAWLWHPGILAKDIAAFVYASQQGAAWLHLTVDHDVSDATTLSVPLRDGNALSVATLTLGRTLAGVPTGSQSAIVVDEMLSHIDAFEQRHAGRLMVDLSTLRDAVHTSKNARTLAEQMTAMHAHVMQPLVGNVPVIGSEDLCKLTATRRLLDDMLSDPQRCAMTYNVAVRRHPESGIAPLHVGYELVELPFWLLTWEKPRQRIYASLVGSRADLITGEGATIDLDDLEVRLAPKALMLTAVMRTVVSDLFIHGAGGAIYDRVMEDWLRTWRGEAVSPMSVSSADLRLVSDAPTSTPHELTHAVWYAHHLPHNVDRHLPSQPVDGSLADEKRRLLAQMESDKDQKRRAIAFQRLHSINEALVQHHSEAISTAGQQVAATQLGVANRMVLQRRDWPLQWYASDDLQRLRDAIEAAFQPV